jgi:hypothetical protein
MAGKKCLYSIKLCTLKSFFFSNLPNIFLILIVLILQLISIQNRSFVFKNEPIAQN